MQDWDMSPELLAGSLQTVMAPNSRVFLSLENQKKKKILLHMEIQWNSNLMLINKTELDHIANPFSYKLPVVAAVVEWRNWVVVIMVYRVADVYCLAYWDK